MPGMPGMNMPPNRALNDDADPHSVDPNAKDNEKVMPANPVTAASTEKK
jgi:hypothetical protein